MGWRGWLIIVVACGAMVLGLASSWPAPPAAPTWVSKPVNAQPMVVDDVLNGDTVILIASSGSQVLGPGKVTARLLGIDAPEFGVTDECYAQEAQAKLASLLVEGTVAWVAIDEVAQDELGRYLMYVWSSEGRFVNYELALGGYVRALAMEPNHERWSAISGAQESATGRLRGIWGECEG